MDLRAKLARLPPKKTQVLDDLRARIQEVLDRNPADRDGTPHPPGPSPPPRAVRVTTHYLEPHHHHGRIPIAKALSSEARLVAELALDPSLEEVDLASALFLDTETTGLSGAGIVPFLIGLGWFEDRSFVIEQLFLEELGEELPMLSRLQERLARASCVVTYNGKAFDWPVLVNRCVLHRIGAPKALPHVDLLHCARRIYKRRLGGVRLIEVEEQVLGMRRERDIDGAEIPGVYWTFLRHRNDAGIAPVIEHNANDLVALAALLAHLAERFERVHAEDDPIDQLARAKLAFRAKDEPRVEQFARAAGEGGGDPDVTVEAYFLLALLYKKRRDHLATERALLEALSAADNDRELAVPVHLELAKLYEHKLKLYDRALAHAYDQKRVARIQRKLSRV
jgi:uncharacterized protein